MVPWCENADQMHGPPDHDENTYKHLKDHRTP
jgi:hypothetical protein